MILKNSKQPNTPISALKENQGIQAPSITNAAAIAKLRAKRKIVPTAKDIIEGILKKDQVFLSQGITLIESSNPEHQIKAQQIIQQVLPFSNKSIRIGITGVPGVGKSTFIEAFGTLLTELGKKVAVLAIDPSSSVTKGSILGDKTRMEELVKNPNAFIRPSASGANLGGVAKKTRESIILCEAAGFDTILVETVGVGQSETAVQSMVDFFLLLNLPGAGDELQGIKRGIMEMADLVVINKADGPNMDKARIAKLQYNRALHLFPKKASNWTPRVRTCSALEHKGIKPIWDFILEYHKLTNDNGYFEQRRAQQNKYWMMETIQEELLANFYKTPIVDKLLQQNKKAVQESEISPFAAAHQILDVYFKNIIKK